MTEDARIRVGVFGAPHGLRGELRLKSLTADPVSIARYGPLEDAAGGRRFELVSVRPLREDMLIARVAGIGDRDSAAALTGVALYVPRAALPAPDEGEYYHADLIGLEARDADGRRFGRIVGVENHGAGDILEIAPDGGGESALLPFTDAIVPKVDVAAGYATVLRPAEIDGDAR